MAKIDAFDPEQARLDWQARGVAANYEFRPMPDAAGRQVILQSGSRLCEGSKAWARSSAATARGEASRELASGACVYFAPAQVIVGRLPMCPFDERYRRVEIFGQWHF